MNLQVVALPMGWLQVDKASLTYGRDYGTPLWIPVWSAAILGAEKKILVDSGFSSVHWVQKTLEIGCRQEKNEGLEFALKTIGWRPEDVDIVINTHLHYDHIGGNSMLKNARFLIQEKEWQHAHHPLKTQVWAYSTRDFDAVDYFQWKLINGTHDVVPGVRVIPTPGHTPGHQSVIVNTAKGRVVITGDAANLVENVVDEVPPTIMWNVADAIWSVELLHSLAAFLIPGHDPSVKPFAENQALPACEPK